MKKLRILCAVTAVYFLAGCGNLSDEKIAHGSEKDGEAHRHDLPGYYWLHSYSNYSNERYQDSLDYHFNHSLDAKNYDDAASYLIAQGNVLDMAMVHDSIFFDKAGNFLKVHIDDISGDAQSNLSYYLGSQSYFKHNLTESTFWLEKAVMPEPTTRSHKQIQGFSNFALAQNYTQFRNFELAEKHLIDALNIFIDIGDVTNQGTVYLLLHNIFRQTSALDEAESNLEKALEIFKKNDIPDLTFSAYSIYVNFNITKADTVGAVKYIDSMAIQAKSMDHLNQYSEAILTQFLAFKHGFQGEEQKAKDYLIKSREITDNLDSPDLRMRTLFQEVVYAEMYDKPLQNPEEVEEFYNKIAKEEDPNRQFLIQLGSALFTYYSKKGDYKKANAYAESLLEDQKRDLDDRIKGRLFELQRKFESEQKENKILVQEKLLQSQKRTIIGLGAGAVFLILVFSILIIWNKNRSILREKALSDSFTSQLLSRTEDERKRIASDLHDSISNELVNLRQALEEKNVQIKSKIDSILEEVRNISRNLSPTLFDKLGLKESIEQLTERAQNQYSFLLTSDITYSGSLKTAVELQLYRIIQEATTNIIKHAEALAGKITITEDSNFVYAEIKDNGKGFNVNKMLEKGNCFGLLNITERAKFINGTANFQSSANGTIIKISIPK